MSKRHWLLSLATIALLATLCVPGVLTAQESRREEGRRRFNPDEMRQRIAQAMKERLRASDDEWTVIQPRLEKVTELRMRSVGGFGGWGSRDRGRDGDRDGDNAQAPQREQSEVSKKAQALSTLLEQENPQPEQIKAALGELRAARQKQEAELKAARDSLREVLSLRQEALLVNMGVLD